MLYVVAFLCMSPWQEKFVRTDIVEETSTKVEINTIEMQHLILCLCARDRIIIFLVCGKLTAIILIHPSEFSLNRK